MRDRHVTRRQHANGVRLAAHQEPTLRIRAGVAELTGGRPN